MALRLPAVLVPQIGSWEEVRQAFSQQLNQLQQNISSQFPIVDYGGSRVQNVGSPQQLGDAVNLGYLHGVLLPQVQGAITNALSQVINNDVTGTGPNGIYFMGSSGTLTPILTSGFTQQAILTASCSIAPPADASSNPMVSFMMEIRQGGSGGYGVSLDPWYHGLAFTPIITTPGTKACLLFQVGTDTSTGDLLMIPMNGGSIA